MERQPFGPDEWYHCYSRGVDKRTVFERPADYERFTDLLFTSNSEKPIHRSNLRKDREALYSLERGAPLVGIGAYTLMPNHFHLLLKDVTEEGTGISRFMQKLGTAYTMYFNISRERTGGLFVKPFRSRHVADDRYFRRVAQYIHFNPIELFEPGWKNGKVRATSKLERTLREYSYSSLIDHETPKSEVGRLERGILDTQAIDLLRSDKLSLADSLDDMREYYASLAL